MNNVPEHIIPVKGGCITESELLKHVDHEEMMICSECYQPYGSGHTGPRSSTTWQMWVFDDSILPQGFICCFFTLDESC